MLKSLLAAAALALTTPLAAADRTEQRVAHVSVADLDLSSDAGKAEFDRRIARAVRTVCPDEMTTAVDKNLEVFRCRRDARNAVAPQRERMITQRDRQLPTVASSPIRSASGAN